MKNTSKPRNAPSNHPLLDSDLPLDHCEGDPNSENIEFALDAIYDMGMFNGLKSPGDFGEYREAICLYHSHVLWSYKLRTTRYNDGTFGMSLVGIGPKVEDSKAHPIPFLANEISAMYKPQQQPPDLLAATIKFVKGLRGEEIATFEFERAGNDVWTCTKHFTREELAAFEDKQPGRKRIYFTMRIIIARSYFDLLKKLKDPPTATGYTKKTVECILRGDKPDGADFEISLLPTNGDRSLPLNYHVHSATFARGSKQFQQMRLENPTDSCCMPRYSPDDMPVIVSLMYGVPVSLPTNTSRMRELLRNTANMCDSDVFNDLFSQWERAICEQALALDKSDPRSFNSIVRLLVFSLSLAVPLPSARAATISVFAEMALVHKKAGVSFDNCRLDHRSLIGKAFATHHCSRSSAQRMSETIFAIVEAVRVVTKTGLATKKKDSEIAVPPVSPPLDFSTPTVIVVEDDDGATADIDAFDEDGNERVQAEKNSPPIS